MDVNDNLICLRNEKKCLIDKMKVNSYYEYSKIDTLNKKIDEICEEIEYYSYFDSEQIGPIIRDLVTLFEGEQFVYQSALYYSQDEKSGLESIKIIVLNDKKQENWYDERYFNSLVKYGNAMALTKTTTFYPHLAIYFYCADELHRVNQNVGFGKFSYIKEFIDGVILYKMNKKEKYISSEELDKLKIDFIKSRIEQIKINNEFTDERKTKEFVLSLQHDKKIRKRNLQKILNK